MFAEDARFLAAVPGDAALIAPTVFATLDGDSELPAYAAAAARDLDALTDGLRAVGEVLRAEVPDERSEVHRAWSAVAVVLQGPEGSEQAWLQAEILDSGEQLEWHASLVIEQGGPWSEVASGTHRVDDSGEVDVHEGSLTWSRAAAASITGADHTGELEITTVRAESRDVTVRVRPDPLSSSTAEYGLVGETAISFPASFDFGNGPVDGAAVAIHTSDGGRADGFLAPDSSAFSACWDPTGDGVYLGPDTVISGYGSEVDCALEPLLGP